MGLYRLTFGNAWQSAASCVVWLSILGRYGLFRRFGDQKMGRTSMMIVQY